MNLVKLSIGQSPRKRIDPADIAKAINLNGRSRLLSMSVSPQHRPKVVEYLDDAAWHSSHTTGHDRQQWVRICDHVLMVLQGTKQKYDEAVKAEDAKAGRK